MKTILIEIYNLLKKLEGQPIPYPLAKKLAGVGHEIKLTLGGMGINPENLQQKDSADKTRFKYCPMCGNSNPGDSCPRCGYYCR